MPAKLDVIIIGGGLVGATCALALAQAGLTLAVIDKNPLVDKTPADPWLRVSALTPASVCFFEHLGIADKIFAAASRLEALQVWERQHFGEINLSAAELGQAGLGYIVSNQHMLQTVKAELAQGKTLQWFSALPRTVEQQDDEVTLELADGQRLTARCLVAADGANSWVRQQMNVPLWEQPYQHSSLIATVSCEKSHQHIAYQTFSERGPLALLPLPKSQTVSIVWSLPEQLAAERQTESEAIFCQNLAKACENKLGAMQLLSKRYTFPLVRRHAKNYVQARLALLGDAIHTFHPLAGQGLNLGLMDSATLAEILIKGHQAGQDIGHSALLRRYERARKGHNLGMLAAVEGFHQLFTCEQPSLALLRNLGMNWTGRGNPLKRWLIKEAMGMNLRQPTYLSKYGKLSGVF